MPKKVLFILPQPATLGPSQRFRVSFYLPYLNSESISYELKSFFTEADYKILYKEGNTIKKIVALLNGFLKRARTVLFESYKYDFIFIQRAASPVGPPVFEWILAKIFRKKVIFDFDDAIWIPMNNGHPIARLFKAYWKVKYICKWSYKVVGGNPYLCNYASQFNNNVVFIPTCVDTQKYHNRIKEHEDRKVVVGWTGSHTTLEYLQPIIPIINSLQENLNFNFTIICNKDPEWDIKDYKFIQWNNETEIEDLLKFDIGVMPLIEDKWTEGKCGFKLIQYLALGIPAVANPAGVNKEIIEDGINGFLAVTEEEWKTSLSNLISDVTLRKQFGEKGRSKIVNHYSIQSQLRKFIDLFQ